MCESKSNYFSIDFQKVKNKIELVSLFLGKKGSITFLDIHLRMELRFGLTAVERNCELFQHLGKNLKDDDCFI